MGVVCEAGGKRARRGGRPAWRGAGGARGGRRGESLTVKPVGPLRGQLVRQSSGSSSRGVVVVCRMDKRRARAVSV